MYLHALHLIIPQSGLSHPKAGLPGKLQFQNRFAQPDLSPSIKVTQASVIHYS